MQIRLGKRNEYLIGLLHLRRLFHINKTWLHKSFQCNCFARLRKTFRIIGLHLGYFELRKYIKWLIDIFIYVHIIYSFLAIILHRRYQSKNS